MPSLILQKNRLSRLPCAHRVILHLMRDCPSFAFAFSCFTLSRDFVVLPCIIGQQPCSRMLLLLVLVLLCGLRTRHVDAAQPAAQHHAMHQSLQSASEKETRGPASLFEKLAATASAHHSQANVTASNAFLTLSRATQQHDVHTRLCTPSWHCSPFSFALPQLPLFVPVFWSHPCRINVAFWFPLITSHSQYPFSPSHQRNAPVARFILSGAHSRPYIPTHPIASPVLVIISDPSPPRNPMSN